jgi:hypothetical protein
MRDSGKLFVCNDLFLGVKWSPKIKIIDEFPYYFRSYDKKH